MATNKVQIQVELKGSEQVNKQLGKIEESAVDLKEGFNGVGESFKSVGDIVRSQGSPMADAFGTLGDSVGAITESVGAFKDGLAVMGETGGKAWVAMLGPIAAIVSGITLAYEAYRQFSGAAQEAEDAAENMAAAAGDTASRLEALTEAGVILGTEALKDFIQVNERSRLAIEESIKINEKRTLSEQKMKQALKDVEEAQNSLFFTDMRVSMAKKDLELATNEYTRALDKQVEASKKANEQNRIAFELQELLMKPYEELLGGYLQEKERLDDLSLRITNTTNIRGKEKKIIEDTLKRKKELINEEIKYKDGLKALETQLNKGNMSQDIFDKANRALRESLEKTRKELKQTNDTLEPYVKLLEAGAEATNSLKSLSKDAFSKANAQSIEDLNRQMTLLDRNLQDQRDTLTDYGFEFNETVKSNIDAIGKEVDTLLRTYALIETSRTKEQKTGVKNTFLPNLIESAKQQTIISNQNIEQLNKATTSKLIDIEEKRIEVLLDIRLKEIDEMEVSERRKKKLREDALQDALYTSKRLAEITKNSVKDELSVAIQTNIEKANIQRMSGLESFKFQTENEKQNRQLRIDEFKAEMVWRKDLILLTAESNKELFDKEDDLHSQIFAAQRHASETELYNLNQHLNSKKEVLEKYNDRYTLEQKKQLVEEINQLQQQISIKEDMQKTADKKYFNEKYASDSRLRDLNLELYVQQQRFERDFTSLFLDNDQIRINSTIEFYQQQREGQKEYYAEELRIFDQHIKDIENKTSELYQKLATIDPKNRAATDEVLAQINQQQSLLQTQEKLKKESLEKQANASREYNDRMYQYDLDHYQQVGGLIKDFSASSSQAMIDAGVAAAFAGESISDSIRTTLRGLAQEATARALFEGAAALGSMAIGDARGATLHGNSAVAFGLAAASMGILTAAVGVPGGSSGGGGATSPSGMSQTSQAPQREEARQEAMVFNINFGNAVIYDTRAAAERAMAERVMSLGMQARRGYVPPRPRI